MLRQESYSLSISISHTEARRQLDLRLVRHHYQTSVVYSTIALLRYATDFL